MPPKCCGFTNNLLSYLFLPKLIMRSQSCCGQEIEFTHLQNLQFRYFFPDTVSGCSKNSSTSRLRSFTERVWLPSSGSGDIDGERNLRRFSGPEAVPTVSNCVHAKADNFLPSAKSEDDSALVVLASSQAELSALLLSSSSTSIINLLERL